MMAEARAWVGLVACNVAHYRKAADMTLDEVATGAGVSLGFIHNIENRRSNPSLATLVGIATVLDIEPALLFLPTVEPAEYLATKTAGCDGSDR